MWGSGMPYFFTNFVDLMPIDDYNCNYLVQRR